MRAYAMELGRVMTAALLLEHAAHRLAKHEDDRAAAVAVWYVQREVGSGAPILPTPQRSRAATRILELAGPAAITTS